MMRKRRNPLPRPAQRLRIGKFEAILSSAPARSRKNKDQREWGFRFPHCVAEASPKKRSPATTSSMSRMLGAVSTSRCVNSAGEMTMSDKPRIGRDSRRDFGPHRGSDASGVPPRHPGCLIKAQFCRWWSCPKINHSPTEIEPGGLGRSKGNVHAQKTVLITALPGHVATIGAPQ